MQVLSSGCPLRVQGLIICLTYAIYVSYVCLYILIVDDRTFERLRNSTSAKPLHIAEAVCGLDWAFVGS